MTVTEANAIFADITAKLSSMSREDIRRTTSLVCGRDVFEALSVGDPTNGRRFVFPRAVALVVDPSAPDRAWHLLDSSGARIGI